MKCAVAFHEAETRARQGATAVEGVGATGIRVEYREWYARAAWGAAGRPRTQRTRAGQRECADAAERESSGSRKWHCARRCRPTCVNRFIQHYPVDVCARAVRRGVTFGGEAGAGLDAPRRLPVDDCVACRVVCARRRAREGAKRMPGGGRVRGRRLVTCALWD